MEVAIDYRDCCGRYGNEVVVVVVMCGYSSRELDCAMVHMTVEVRVPN